MKEIGNQNGLATLEIILAVAIVGIFFTIAVPKITRLVDKVCLDYETKSLYSELNLARSVGKSATFNGGIFPDIENSQDTVELWIYGKNYSTKSLQNYYALMQTSLSLKPNFIHQIQNDIVLDFTGGNKILKISFDNASRYSSWSNTLILSSKFDYETKIYFDSVGRWRGEYVK